MMTHFLIFFVGCFVLTGIVRRYALWRHALAVPEFRHGPLEPTPRGGGIALSLSMLGLLVMLNHYGLLDIDATRSLSFSGLIAVLACLLHDVRPLSVKQRIGLQFLAAAAALNWYGRDLIVVIFDGYVYLTDWWLPLLALGIVVFINLTNFMDGIDGFAGSQAFVMMFASSCLLAISGEEQWALPLILMCAPVLGFLAWNWPPAKIFMGDAGSSFLGVFITVLGLYLAADTAINVWCWLILMGWFVVDGCWSLAVRMLRGKDWHRSHRMHAYQILARRWDSHVYVTLLLWLVDWLWLFPLAYLAMESEALGLVWLLVAYLPLCAGCWYLKAGEPRELAAAQQ